MEKLKTGLDLKTWRERYHLTQKELADKIGYSKEAICRIERAENKPLSTHFISKFEKAFSIEDPILQWTYLQSLQIGKEEIDKMSSLLCSILCIRKIKRTEPIEEIDAKKIYLKSLNTIFYLISQIQGTNFKTKNDLLLAFQDLLSKLLSKKEWLFRGDGG